MYNLPQYKEPDPARIIDFMKAHPFAILTGFDETYPVATHIPLEVEQDANGKITLSGHMMRKTDHQLAFEKNNKILVVFNGPHCYVSASWYQDPKGGSTWNYMTVHAKGTLHFTDEQGTYEAVKAITHKYEGTQSAAAFSQLSDEYIASMVKAIVGFKIEVESLEHVFKLSQNRDAVSYKNIIEQLKQRTDDDSRKIAGEMEERINNYTD
jgi:transcriptional regulator